MKFPHTVFFFVDVLFAKYDSKLTKFFLDPSKKYHLVLVASKEKKVCAANNKSFDLDIKSIDVYDELLTQEEIQSHIDKINQLLALERVEGNQQEFIEKCSIFLICFIHFRVCEIQRFRGSTLCFECKTPFIGINDQRLNDVQVSCRT